MEFQLRNWQHMNWLGGDSLVEQAIHSVDKIGWVMGDIDPVSCVGMGGRQQPMPGGQTFDHFAITYEYPNGIRAFMHSRQQVGVYNENSDYITGEDGVLTIGKGKDPFIQDMDGKPKWRFRAKKDSGIDPNMYQQEHTELFASIRGEKAHNDGEWMTHSCLLGIMGRNAAYTGQKVTWEDLIADETSLYPEGLEWDSGIEVGPEPRPGGFVELTPAKIKV
jgi:predicted dehydrogenase